MLDSDLGNSEFAFFGPRGVGVAPNLTSHKDGLAGYSDDELRAMITKGKRPGGPPRPNSYLAKMTDDNLSAIILYPRSLPSLPGGGQSTRRR